MRRARLLCGRFPKLGKCSSLPTSSLASLFGAVVVVVVVVTVGVVVVFVVAVVIVAVVVAVAVVVVATVRRRRRSRCCSVLRLRRPFNCRRCHRRCRRRCGRRRCRVCAARPSPKPPVSTPPFCCKSSASMQTFRNPDFPSCVHVCGLTRSYITIRACGGRRNTRLSLRMITRSTAHEESAAGNRQNTRYQRHASVKRVFPPLSNVSARN